jgi:penicillin-binding protein 2
MSPGPRLRPPGRDLAIDLGTANTLIHARGRGVVLAGQGDARTGARHDPRRAAAVVDVTNGAVVAAASSPAYDPGVFSGGISSTELARLSDPAAGPALTSRLTAETLPPASTFKVVSVPAVVNAGARLDGPKVAAPAVRRIFDAILTLGL